MRYLFLFISIFSFGQQTQKVDFLSANALIKPNAVEKSVTGKVTYVFNVKSSIDTIKIDAVKMDFTDVKINKKPVQFKTSGKSLQLFEGFQKGENELTFEYSATPKQAMYFVGDPSTLTDQIWTQGQGKYTSHWLPSFDNVNEKVIFNISVEYRNDYEVISNGKLENKKVNDKGSHITWEYEMDKPMSSYLVMLAIGKYEKQTLKSDSGVPIELYLKPADRDKFETTYKYMTQIFDFFEEEIGVKYPWKIYKQAPVDDFLYAGMENTSATLFSQDFVVDEIGFNDRNYVNVNAHELAHQWFGDLVTASEGKHHWLQEGFATYYALLAEREIFGNDYFYFELSKNAEELRDASKTDTIPVLDEKASTLSFYQKGAWALHYLRTQIGPKEFSKAVKAYLKKNQYKNVETNDFLTEISKVAEDFDIAKFKKLWLTENEFPIKEVNEILAKNKTIKEYFEIKKLGKKPFSEKKITFKSTLKDKISYKIKREVVYQLEKIPFEEKKDHIKLALQTNNVQIRQAVAQTISKITPEFKPQYETLLDDKSYDTREIALENLFNQFPDDRTALLEKSKDWVGSNDKSLRITWLNLALSDEKYEPASKPAFYAELLNYSQPNYDSSIRKNALERLLMLNPTDEKVLTSLVNATTHHKWQFVAFAKNTIRTMLKNEKFKTAFQELLPKLNEKEQNFLKGELK
ncbi:MAG: M1 family metallopeptidase [Bacteroidota bacterium]